ncbi:dihydroorotase [Nocardioides sp. Soil805]|uniref:dihydroorotase n=1 Tax=Nocardioides sp. Soil805 TaxID=1736416 RepID=UPI000702F372|nr:dihydroorotase [Nocardioides sp. Soil805]KRF35992.1 dihydroorotase [Nocardioides sp. Soil805]
MGATRGLVITGASLLGERSGDLYVDDAGLLVDEAPAGAEVLDADGLVALPGLVDLHTHLREPGREDAETILTGSRAAAVGGFTAVLAMANTSPVTDTAEAALRVLDLGREAGLVHVQPVGAVTRGLGGEELAELGLMARSRARVRVFSDDGKCVHDARVMRRALEYVKAFGGVVSQHAQDPTLAGPTSCCHEGELSGRLGLPGWPGIAEEVIVARDVMLARHTGSRVHIAHVSTAGSVDVLRWAKAQGIDVTAEVTPHHLLLTTDLLTGYDPTYKVNPPLRPQEDVDALREALADGTVDAVATDHAPHARHDKEHAFVDAAFGMLGLETALGVVRTALPDLSWARVAQVMSTTPARIAGLADHGSLAIGSPAHVTLVDPAATTTVDRATSVSLSRNNPWHGRTLASRVVHTVYGGRLTVRDGALL